MAGRNLSRYALSLSAAALLAACGESQLPIGATNAMPQSSVIAAHAGPRPQTCPRGFAECVTLKYGSPFEQELCVYDLGVTFGPSCIPNGGTYYWLANHLKGYGGFRHHRTIKFSFYPQPGNPTEMTISESQRIKSSHGKIAFRVGLEANYGNHGTLPRDIGIITE